MSIQSSTSVTLSQAELATLLHDAGANALRAAATDARVRGDIGKDGGVEAEDWLENRAQRLESRTETSVFMVSIDPTTLERGSARLAELLSGKAYEALGVRHHSELNAVVREVVETFKD